MPVTGDHDEDDHHYDLDLDLLLPRVDLSRAPMAGRPSDFTRPPVAVHVPNYRWCYLAAHASRASKFALRVSGWTIAVDAVDCRGGWMLPCVRVVAGGAL